MQALVCHGARDFRMEQRDFPRPGPEEVLIKPLFNGICFTDKHVFDGHVARAAGWTLGHEFSARIIDLGSSVTDWRVGDLVSVDPRLYCGACLPCRAGLESLCTSAGFIGVDGAHGGLADACIVPAYSLYALPTGCTPEQASCVEAACCATRAVRSGAIVAGDNIVLLGLEDYNLYMAQWLKASGAQIIAVDPEPVRREAALAFGADAAFDPRQDKLVSAIRSLMPFGADAVMVAVEDYVPEAQAYVALAHRLARIQGQVIMMRSYGAASQAQVQPTVPWLKELTIRHFGNFFGNEPARGGRARGDWQVTLDAMARGTLHAPPPGSTVLPFSALDTPEKVANLFDHMTGTSSKVIIAME